MIYLLAEEKYVVVQHARGEVLIEESLRQLEDALAGDAASACIATAWCLAQRLLGLNARRTGACSRASPARNVPPEVSRRNLPALRKLVRCAEASAAERASRDPNYAGQSRPRPKLVSPNETT